MRRLPERDGLQNRALRDDAARDVAPQRDDEFARDGDNPHAPLTFPGPEVFAIPPRERALRLPPHPIPGQLNTDRLQPRITGATDALVPRRLAAWQTIDPGRRRQQTLDGLKRLLLREAREQPLLLIFEDLHWIDGETQALLDALVDSLGSARLLLLVNYRPEYQLGGGSWGCTPGARACGPFSSGWGS